MTMSFMQVKVMPMSHRCHMNKQVLSPEKYRLHGSTYIDRGPNSGHTRRGLVSKDFLQEPLQNHTHAIKIKQTKSTYNHINEIQKVFAKEGQCSIKPFKQNQ